MQKGFRDVRCISNDVFLLLLFFFFAYDNDHDDDENYMVKMNESV